MKIDDLLVFSLVWSSIDVELFSLSGFGEPPWYENLIPILGSSVELSNSYTAFFSYGKFSPLKLILRLIESFSNFNVFKISLGSKFMFPDSFCEF